MRHYFANIIIELEMFVIKQQQNELFSYLLNKKEVK